MRHKQALLLTLVFLLQVTACVEQPNKVEPYPQTGSPLGSAVISHSREKTQTPVFTSTSLPSPTLTLTLAPTWTATALPTTTPTPIPPKPVLISYRVMGGDGVDEIYACLLWFYEYSFVLYEDGQLIFKDEEGLKETFLSEHEVNNLLDDIKQTGFFQVDGTGELREQDPIYQNAPERVGDGGAGEYLTVQEKTVSIYAPLRNYLVEPVKRTLDLILKYQPRESHSYVPDRLWLWVFPVDNSENRDWGVATPIPPVDEWVTDVSPLSKLANEYNYALLEGDDIQSVVGLFRLYPSSRVFKEGGQEFYVVACPVLP